VCIRTFNRAAWLKECLESVVRQEGVPFEIILVNNGSTDGGETAKIVDDYAEVYPNLIRAMHCLTNDPDRSLYGLCNGEYITMLPDDDVLMGVDSLARRAAVLDEHPNVGFVFTNALCMDAKGSILDAAPSMWALHGDKDVLTNAAPLDIIIRDCVVPFPSAMWRSRDRDTAESTHVRICKVSADWALWIALSAWNDQAYLASPSVILRVHAEQDSIKRGMLGRGFVDAHLAMWEYWSETEVLSIEALTSFRSTIARYLDLELGYRRMSVIKRVEEIIVNGTKKGTTL